MKIKNIILLLVAISLSATMLSGCGSQQQPQMVNELSYSLNGITQITISYDDENISFYQSENDELIIKEYISEDKESYYANTTQTDDSIKISEGGKPLFKGGFQRYIEVYLPEDYKENLKITTTNGNIDLSNMCLDMKSIRIDSTSGTLKINEANATDIHLSSTKGKMELGTIIAENIKIETTKGSVSCESIEGSVSYTSTSGNGEFLSASGSGSYKASNSGKLTVVYKEVTGDISLYNKNDNINLTLPAALDFEFKATTKNGSVKTNFQDNISKSGKTTSGSIGNNPTVTVKTETKNGDIEVTR